MAGSGRERIRSEVAAIPAPPVRALGQPIDAAYKCSAGKAACTASIHSGKSTLTDSATAH